MLKRIVEKLTPRKENIRPLILSITITGIFFTGHYFLGNHFAQAIWLFNGIVLGLLLAGIMIFAGFTVVKSLFAISAELSLLIFLAQSYCDVANRSIASNEALKSLLTVSLLYIAFIFCRSLYKALQERYKTVEGKPWSKEKIGVVALFLAFTGLFLWQIYLVINPIISDLCVYR